MLFHIQKLAKASSLQGNHKGLDFKLIMFKKKIGQLEDDISTFQVPDRE